MPENDNRERLSPERLAKIAAALGMHPDGLGPQAAGESEASIFARQIVELLSVVSQIESTDTRTRVIELVREIAAAGDRCLGGKLNE